MDRRTVAQITGYDTGTIRRIEQGEQGTRRLLVERLCEIYGIASSTRAKLIRLVEESSRRGWWDAYKHGLAPQAATYVEHEQEASLIQSYETEWIHGLLQDEAYIRQTQQYWPSITEDLATEVRKFRLERQRRVLAQRQLPSMKFLMSKSVLDFMHAMPDAVNVAQSEALARLSDLPSISIGVADAPHPAMFGQFTVVTPQRDGWQPFVYTEHGDGCRYVESSHVVSMYQNAFEQAFEMSTPLKEHL